MDEFGDPFRIEDEDGQWVHIKPWTERNWTEYYRATATIHAKRKELLETIESHPEDKEVLEADLEFISRDFPRRPHYDQDPKTEDEYEELHECKLICLEELPVWQHAERWAEAVLPILGPLMNATRDSDPEAFKALDWLFWDVLDPQHELEKGRDQGFADEYLCANILCCRKALKAADKAIVSLQSAIERGFLPKETADPLIARGRIVAVLIEAYIKDLCKRVWWT
mgnify:FL=1